MKKLIKIWFKCLTCRIGNLIHLLKLLLCSFQITVSPENLLPRDTDEDLGGGHVDDMTKLTYLNEPGVLYNLKKRYALNEIYVSGLPALFLFTVVICIST